ncbi:hypothetical protein F5Y06DRAFT_299801 [Hypoxylon sp. FL0890]|nr:hypothetical protein F5Y06DRAFT_299801 [Hypoxylon sp. FL0890]
MSNSNSSDPNNPRPVPSTSLPSRIRTPLPSFPPARPLPQLQLAQSGQENQATHSNAQGSGATDGVDYRPYRCSKCSHRAKRQGHLYEHQYYMHIGTTCMFPGCTTQTATDADLRTHIMNNHGSASYARDRDRNGVKKWRIRCSWPGCSKTHSNRANLHRCCFRHCYESAQSKNNYGDTGTGGSRDLGVNNNGDIGGGGPERLGTGPQRKHSFAHNDLDLEPEDEDGGDYIRQLKPVDNATVMEAINALTEKVNQVHDSLTTQFREVRDTLEQYSYRLRDVETVVHRLEPSAHDLENPSADRPRENAGSSTPPRTTLPTLANLLNFPGKRPADTGSLSSRPHKQPRID